MLRNLWNDEYGVVISAELVFILTILVIGMVVGLSELQHAVVYELEDIGDAIGALNQSYLYTGFSATKPGKTASGGFGSFTRGSVYSDTIDDCDATALCQPSEVGCDAPALEKPQT